MTTQEETHTHPTAATVFIVDDDRRLRDALRGLLETKGFRVETFGSASAFLDACKPARRGCLILDVGLPDMDGLTLQRLLTARHVALPIIVLTGKADVPKAVQALKAGAVDFLEKPADVTVLLERVRTALAEDVEAHESEQRKLELAERLESLTPREREILALVASGLSSKEIARRLDISYRTVEGHRQNIRQKTGAESTPELVDIARACGLNR